MTVKNAKTRGFVRYMISLAFDNKFTKYISPGGGTLTLTGIPAKFDGKYAQFQGKTADTIIAGAGSNAKWAKI